MESITDIISSNPITIIHFKSVLEAKTKNDTVFVQYTAAQLHISKSYLINMVFDKYNIFLFRISICKQYREYGRLNERSATLLNRFY